MRVAIAGGSGLIGRGLVKKLLECRYDVILLSRDPEKTRMIFPAVHVGFWDAKTSAGLKEILRGTDAVINLAGEPIAAKRWTGEQKQKILSSRICSTKAIVDAIEQAENRPRIFLNASAVGYYGDVPEGDVTESYPKGKGFLADVCESWEDEALMAGKFGVRVALLRTGIVLDKKGGALEKLLLPFRLFAGGPIGSGKQWMPWIHIQDQIDAIVFALQNEIFFGPVNLTAPEPVRMSEFCKILGKVLHRPSWLPVPSFVLRYAIGEMVGPLLLYGQKAIPEKLLDAGFEFTYIKLEEALKDIIGQ